MTSYSDSGVHLDAADAAVARIKPAVVATWGNKVIGGFGGFAAGLRMPDGYTEPVLMMSTDGVGTKAEVARQTGKVDGLGWDLVAMCIDDLVAAGGRPIAMSDYIAIGEIDTELVVRIVESVAAACAAADVALVGGEIAEHPGVMEPDAFDVAGTALGIVEASAVIDGSRIVPGDVIIGIDSPNLRSNGYSLVRRLINEHTSLDATFPGTDRTVADVVLEPSVLYTPSVLALIDTIDVKGLAHITGGGLLGNLPRILPATTDAVIETGSWVVPDVFTVFSGWSGADRAERYSTWNMGIGFVAVVAPGDVTRTLETIATHARSGSAIGVVTPGTGVVQLT